MPSHRHLLVATLLIGLGMVPRTGAAQSTGTSPERVLYLTNDPTRQTCVYPEELETGETTSRCYVMECDVDGDRCACPVKLTNGWKQPLNEEQCQQLVQVLRPLPPAQPAEATAKEKPKVASPATQAAKDKEEDRKLYTVRLQAQGNGVEESVVLAGPIPIKVAEGLKGLEILKGKLSPKELQARADCFRRAERFMRGGPPVGIAQGRRSFYPREGGPIRVDVEIIRGINFRE